MHFRLYAIFNKDFADNSKKARRYAYGELLNDPSFCGEGGRFNSPIADWFVVGGRWSGDLQASFNNFFEEVKKLPEFSGDFISESDTKKYAVKLQGLWKRLGGTGKNPYNRDDYDDQGGEDDAQLITKEIYDTLLKKYEGKTDDSEDSEYNELHFVDLDYDCLDESVIGNKWIVVVDYHN